VELEFQQNGRWKVCDLSSNNVPANAVCDILIQNTSSDTAYYVGVRQIGTSLEHPFKLPPKGTISKMVKADKYSKIEIYAEDNTKIKFILTGCF
jgi:hypothetical protein